MEERLIRASLWVEGVKRKLRGENGQGMVEYVLILSAIAVACMGTYILLGGDIDKVIKAVRDKLIPPSA